MNLSERNFRYQPPAPAPVHRRKTPSFSSSLLDSILRSIDETNVDGGFHEENLNQQQVHNHNHHHDNDSNNNNNEINRDYDHDLMFFASETKRISKIRFQQQQQTHLIHGEEEEEQIPSLRRAIMIDQWIETHNNNNNRNNRNRNGYVSEKSSRKFSSDSSSSCGTTTFTNSSVSSETETPSTYRSLPNSFTISRKTAEAVFLDDTQKLSSNSKKNEAKFIRSTKLKAMKIYGDLKKVKQPMSPGSRISSFLYSLFASSSSKKAKIEETMQNLQRSLKISRSINKQDNSNTTTTCSSFSRSCMSKKQQNNGIKRSVRFYPENDTVILDSNSKSMKYEREKYDQIQRQWFTEKTYMNKYKNFLINVEDHDDEDEDEDDLFELEIVGGVGTGAYRQELPVFETTDLRKIRI